MDIRTVVSVLLRWYWVLGLCTLAGLGGALYANSVIEPVYEAGVLVAVNQLSTEGSLTSYDNLLANELLAKSYAETINSRPIMAQVITALELEMSPEELNDHVSAVLMPDTQLMRVVVTASEPQRAADIANTTVAVFREQNQARLAARYAIAREALTGELATTQEEVDWWTNQVSKLRESPSTRTSEQTRDAEATLNRHRVSFEALSEALASVRLAETQAADSVDVLELAYPSYNPIWPDPLLNLVIAAVSGLGIGAGIALFLGKPQPLADPSRAS